MQAEIKKLKVTKSVIQQSEKAQLHEFKDLNVLGWCNYKTGKYLVKYIILNDEEKGVIKKYIFFKEIETRFNHEYRGKSSHISKSWDLAVKTPSFVNLTYNFNSEKDLKEAIRLLEGMKKTAIERGQFYI